MNLKYLIFSLLCLPIFVGGQQPVLSEHSSGQSVFLRSSKNFGGLNSWAIKKVSTLKESGGTISSPSYRAVDWLPAIVPGTVLNTLVANHLYPEPYYGDQNRKEKGLIPDINEAGAEFYHYWFRTEFTVPKGFLLVGKNIFLKFHGINYRSEIWVNGKKIGQMAGMFNAEQFDVTKVISMKGKNVLAVKVFPVDVPGSSNRKKAQRPGATGENANGGDGEIGKNVTMLMSVGWDFTVPDGIRDRNTGIWKDVELFSTGPVLIENPFVKTKMPLPDTTSARLSLTSELNNVTNKVQSGVLKAVFPELGITLIKKVMLRPGETRQVELSPEEYKELNIQQPRIWWPLNKGKQNLYTLKLSFVVGKAVSGKTDTRFGIREISSDQNTPDRSRRFLVNGYPVFIRGSNWVPEAMLRNSEERTYAELRYTRQAGINFLRLWGGGIAESDYFYRLCDEMGIMVWSEFWITGDTRFPTDTALYFKNMEHTVKRIRNHASSAYYVSANESTELKGAAELISALDPTKGYQPQSECCGIHDGSPYKYENPMQYFENTASKRGSRVDGFNPEYGTPILPVLSSLKKLMPEKDLWPINKQVWDYLDGGGFHQMTTKYNEAVEQFGKPDNLADFAKKAQFVGAMNFRSVWEVWNYNKFGFGDRFASGLLFWYHNCPVPQVSARFYDWWLEPTAGLYYSQNGLAPLHPQFDYIKNTISVYNDFRRPFPGYHLKAKVYGMNSKEVLRLDKIVDIPADGLVKDALTLDFPKDISNVHFIKLLLEDEKGKAVADAFYWRSKDEYKGAWTMTGPATGGFQEINKLTKTTLSVISTEQRSGKVVLLKVNVKNTGNSLSFFTQLRLADQRGMSVSPAFYSDNFFNLLPGEEKAVKIEIPSHLLNGRKLALFADSFNAKEEKSVKGK